MTRPLAVLDSSTLILLLTEKADESPEEIEQERRRQLVKERIREMQPRFRWAIPAVVVAELGRDLPADMAVRSVGAVLGRFRVLPLTYSGACLASRISTKALKDRRAGSERGAIKYDALICATAIDYGADCIVTENPRDFAKHVAELGASLEIVIPSAVPATGQLHLLHQTRKPPGQ